MHKPDIITERVPTRVMVGRKPIIMKLGDISNNLSFRRIAACLRPANIVSVRMKHKDIPLETLSDYFAKLSFNEPLITSNPAQYLESLNKLAAAVRKINERLTIRAEDLAWLQAQLATPEAAVTTAMLAAFASAPEGRFVTPSELARVTDDAERTWRERAERGDIPAAIKRGKYWYLSPSVVEVMYRVDLSGIATESDPDEPEVDELSELSPEEIERALDRARSEV